MGRRRSHSAIPIVVPNSQAFAFAFAVAGSSYSLIPSKHEAKFCLRVNNFCLKMLPWNADKDPSPQPVSHGPGAPALPEI
ncbi:hypothetical protein E2562_033955 [Oryza meyeriana var. granulata]|uniref:Uncharacterized protein n=1 Tax=Oryza meyeriana var. granulata TaxID=110450 RepID=A0A6G1C0U9_9ORYZ|nr:hypothetical protein E2562_033955 [Oryza meyeriana var. granulata]